MTRQEREDLEKLGFDMRNVECQNNMSLPELATHLASQASMRARWAAKAERASYLYTMAEDEFDIWLQIKKDYVIRQLESAGERASVARVDSYLSKKYSEALRKYKKKLARLKYREKLLRGLLKSIDTKAEMLQSLRNVLQDPYLREQIVTGKIKIKENNNARTKTSEAE